MLDGLTGYDLLFVAIIIFTLWVIALVQIAQSKASGTTVALWVVIATFVGVLGPILWFTIGKRSAAREAEALRSRF